MTLYLEFSFYPARSSFVFCALGTLFGGRRCSGCFGASRRLNLKSAAFYCCGFVQLYGLVSFVVRSGHQPSIQIRLNHHAAILRQIGSAVENHRLE